jgi:hypothetical protein
VPNWTRSLPGLDDGSLYEETAEIRGCGIGAKKKKSGTSWLWKSLDQRMLGDLKDQAVPGANRGE